MIILSFFMVVATRTFDLRHHRVDLNVSPDELFMPNQVTKIFSETVQINPDDVVIDAGSGVGPLAVWAGLEPSREVHAVEIVAAQYALLCKNIRDNGLAHKVFPYQGGFFDPLPSGLRANVIIADVSGIAEGPARALGWYPPSIPTGGLDGTGVIIPLLEQAGRYLHPDGRVYFPVALGLSDSDKTMDVAQRLFGKLELKVEQPFPLTADQASRLEPHIDASAPYLKLESRGTRKLWKGHFYEASKPRYS